jgi:hypothetical protein
MHLYSERLQANNNDDQVLNCMVPLQSHRGSPNLKVTPIDVDIPRVQDRHSKKPLNAEEEARPGVQRLEISFGSIPRVIQISATASTHSSTSTHCRVSARLCSTSMPADIPTPISSRTRFSLYPHSYARIALLVNS